MNQLVKVIITVPEDHADKLRQAIADVGGGHIGNYTHASFSVKGIGRFKPKAGAHPNIGQIDKLEEVPEERIEITCQQGNLKAVVQTIRKVHPYEEPVIDIYPLLSED